MLTDRDGNGYPKPETRWVFAPLGYGFGSTFRPVGLLMGTKSARKVTNIGLILSHLN